jgi:hypothetical protein
MKIKNNTNRGIIPFIILTFLGILVALFAMGYFTEQHPFGLGNYKKILKLDCGLTLYAPKKDASVSFPYKVYGYGNGCDWEPVNGVIGTATLLAGNGLIISKVDLPVSAANIADGKPYYFEATLNPPVSFFSEEGTIIIQNMLPGLQKKYISIPVHFKSGL